MRIHELKVAGVFFPSILDGSKRFEIRKNDRGYQVGDWLLLRELTEFLVFTGRWALVRVEFILDDVRYGMQDNHIIMSLAHYHQAGETDEGFDAYKPHILAVTQQ